MSPCMGIKYRTREKQIKILLFCTIKCNIPPLRNDFKAIIKDKQDFILSSVKIDLRAIQQKQESFTTSLLSVTFHSVSTYELL